MHTFENISFDMSPKETAHFKDWWTHMWSLAFPELVHTYLGWLIDVQSESESSTRLYNDTRSPAPLSPALVANLSDLPSRQIIWRSTRQTKLPAPPSSGEKTKRSTNHFFSIKDHFQETQRNATSGCLQFF
ncbi:uncharacterized protein LOC127262512 [Andrographis paniculata]|uniref:uncharacterized protein LOC127262512 n=1 Tax=Andrographis paniculata TaxID=175694 RepID=UPI0021E91B25|nr:uncharacterized protein LOC127262512 [Andrographis paniculata]